MKNLAYKRWNHFLATGRWTAFEPLMKCGTVGANQVLSMADIPPAPCSYGKFIAYLRQFLQEGKVVSEEDVTAFSEALKGKGKMLLLDL